MLRRYALGTAGAYLTSLEVTYCYIVIPLDQAKKLVSVEDVPSAPLQGKDIHPRIFMVIGLIENRFDGA